MSVDHTRIDMRDNPLEERMTGTTWHGNINFDVPYISEIAPNLYQGGCRNGLKLPSFINHVVSLYPWERYALHRNVRSELYVEMYDAEDQGTEQVDQIARWINLCREDGAVLVHCQAGLNRSSLVAARALWAFAPGAITGDDIVAHLREARSPACLCNNAFEEVVRSWG